MRRRLLIISILAALALVMLTAPPAQATVRDKDGGHHRCLRRGPVRPRRRHELVQRVDQGHQGGRLVR